jgi:hypothetical protein
MTLPTSIEEIVATAARKSQNDTSLAVKLHDAVRDTVMFGFTPFFDAATPEQTLRMGVGHCNPQARLMVALFRLGGLQARFKPVTITDAILKGVVQAVPRLSHVFTEVKIGQRWVRIDSYIVDEALRSVAVSKLRGEGRILGYGCHATATGRWNGTSDSYSQVATPDMIIEEHPAVDEIQDFYDSDRYLHRFGPFSFNLLFSPARPFTSFMAPLFNMRIELLRAQGRKFAGAA